MIKLRPAFEIFVLGSLSIGRRFLSSGVYNYLNYLLDPVLLAD